MARNLITLSGGPEDGKRHYWTGGDTFNVISRQNSWDREPRTIGRYERSEKDAMVLVFHPAD